MTQQDYLWKVDRAKRLSFEYYVLNRPSVSDEVFDGLVAQIEQAEQEHPEWTVADSPTQQVGSDLNGNAVTGSNPPKDSATYIENASVSAGAAATAPEGYVFDHWDEFE